MVDVKTAAIFRQTCTEYRKILVNRAIAISYAYNILSLSIRCIPDKEIIIRITDPWMADLMLWRAAKYCSYYASVTHCVYNIRTLRGDLVKQPVKKNIVYDSDGFTEVYYENFCGREHGADALVSFDLVDCNTASITTVFYWAPADIAPDLIERDIKNRYCGD